MALHVKRAVTDQGMARLRHEAEVLDTVRHPGVAELVELVEDAHAVELRVSAIPGPSLAEADPLGVEEIAGVMAAVTATLADVHALGYVHGAVEASHVVLAPDGRPVLCSFGSATRIDAGADPATDVRAVGAVIVALLDALPDDGGRPGRHLASIARNAVDSPPPASVLAATLAARIAGSRLPGAISDADTARPAALADLLHRPHRRRRIPVRALLVVGAVVVVVVAGVSVSVPRVPHRSIDPPRTRGTVVAASPTTTTIAPPPVPVRVWPTSTTTSMVAPTSDGSLVHDGQRWVVGEPGDIVVTGDWGCTGEQTVALMRPSTGAVYGFPDWPDGDHEIAATSLGTVDGATALHAADRDGDGCDDLVVTRREGDPVVLSPSRTAPTAPTRSASPAPAGHRA